MIKHFLNLSNGLLWIPKLKEQNLLFDPKDLNFIRIQSTTIERKNWIKLFNDLDHNLLMSLALGHDYWIYDMGTNRLFSKVIYQALPIIDHCLSKYWFGEEKPYRRTRTGKIIQADIDYYNKIYHSIFVTSNSHNQLGREKARYYKRFLQTDYLWLTGISTSTDQDGNTELMNEILRTIT